MYTRLINGVEYNHVVFEEKGFIVHMTSNRYNGKYNNKYRLVNTRAGDKYHTHLNSLNACKRCIDYVEHRRIPLVSKKYIIKSCIKLASDKGYRDKLQEYYDRKHKKVTYNNKARCLRHGSNNRLST